jgi:hypothetical protein
MSNVVEEWIDTSEAGELVDVKRMFGMMRELQKPVLFCNLAIPTQKKGDLYAELERRQDIPFQTPERAARALRHLVEYSEYLGVAGGGG